MEFQDNNKDINNPQVTIKQQLLNVLKEFNKAQLTEVNSESKEAKVARLIILLNKIEEQLITIKDTLIELNNNKYLAPSSKVKIEEKIENVDRLTLKIQKARLNLNFVML
jgi:hypothetical protein